MASKHLLKIFISYASGDRARARELHEYLVAQGADPWLDTENLLPGQDWKMEIARALDETDLILLCLSKASVTREGYVQKEMRLALDRALEIPQGEIFLIPARFEEVELPYSLRDYQWVDLYTESGRKKLLKSLNLRAKKVEAVTLSGTGDVTFTEKKSASKKEPVEKSSGTVINVHGNITGSNIVIGNDNRVGNDSKD